MLVNNWPLALAAMCMASAALLIFTGRKKNN
ncbi:LPXTG cell wall anchor domain-containing protein [Oenococcus sicerae]